MFYRGVEVGTYNVYAPRIMFVKHLACGSRKNKNIAGHLHVQIHIIASSNKFKCDGASGVPRASTHATFLEKLYCYMEALDDVHCI